ncbi:protein kinase family protein [Mycolicibacterium aurum]|uniref:non-specific serine/threonine protein kinase n=1 Tax=Mycolicibacterium aurum TaxID=1791 RepID=A0A3S5EJJ3_MYCAU|nr:serine/threonine-protein kinase [Mycolicibacterium aurum]VEG55552.1 protein kinase family protein [Mycolicibacterium aurum]
MPLAAGETFAGYTIVRLLGSGGMGEVYLARHPRLPRQDALKVLPAKVSADPEYRQRFDREADIAATLWHPHIVGVHDRGEDDGQLWISMDYVEGTDAAHLLAARDGKGMPAPQVAEIITAVAEALDYAHERHLLHRDVKPANILVARPGAPDQRILLADFGIARWDDDISGLTATNMTVGTVNYAAPEQLMGRQLDGRADQYALAATAFHLLTGTPPFSHSNPAVVIGQHLSAAPPVVADHRPDLADVDPVLAKGLAKEPGDRFERCADFAHALTHRLTAGAPAQPDVTRLSTSRAVGSAPDTDAPRSRLRPAILVPAVLAVLLVVAIAVAAVEFLRADRTDEPVTARQQPTATTTPSVALPPPPTTATTDVTTEVTDTVTDTVTPTSTAPAAAVIGANCAPLDSTSTTESGATAYCASVPGSASTIWSLTQGEVPSPTSTPPPDPTEPPIPAEEAFPVLTCMEQTGQTRRECRRDIRDSNGQPPVP